MKLKMLLNVFAFTILVGVVAGTKLCFSSEMVTCLPGVVSTSLIPDSSECQKSMNCLRKASETCKETESPPVKELIANVFDLCTTGSDIQKKVLENQQCLKGIPAQKEPCYIDMIAVIAGVNTEHITYEQQKKLYKVICSLRETVQSCVQKAYERACGDASEYLFKRLEEPTFELNKEVCVEIGGGLNLKASFWCIILQMLFITALFQWSKT